MNSVGASPVVQFAARSSANFVSGSIRFTGGIDATLSSETLPSGTVNFDNANREAKSAYQHFLTLWKDADPDIPVLVAAKAEYAKLHQS
jgi:hypothetical protein